jgi:MFS family permease
MKTPAIDKDFDPARMHPAPDRPFPAKPFREAEIMWRRLSLMWCRLSLGENPVAFANPSTKPSTMPVALVAWSALGIALNVGLARFAYGIVLPSLRRDLDLNYLTSGSLNAVHLLGYLVGTLAAPSLARIIGLRTLLVRAHVLVAAGALLCAITPHGISDGIPGGTLNGTLNGASGPLVLGVAGWRPASARAVASSPFSWPRSARSRRANGPSSAPSFGPASARRSSSALSPHRFSCRARPAGG